MSSLVVAFAVAPLDAGKPPGDVTDAWYAVREEIEKIARAAARRTCYRWIFDYLGNEGIRSWMSDHAGRSSAVRLSFGFNENGEKWDASAACAHWYLLAVATAPKRVDKVLRAHGLTLAEKLDVKQLLRGGQREPLVPGKNNALVVHRRRPHHEDLADGFELSVMSTLPRDRSGRQEYLRRIQDDASQVAQLEIAWLTGFCFCEPCEKARRKFDPVDAAVDLPALRRAWTLVHEKKTLTDPRIVGDWLEDQGAYVPAHLVPGLLASALAV